MKIGTKFCTYFRKKCKFGKKKVNGRWTLYLSYSTLPQGAVRRKNWYMYPMLTNGFVKRPRPNLAAISTYRWYLFPIVPSTFEILHFLFVDKVHHLAAVFLSQFDHFRSFLGCHLVDVNLNGNSRILLRLFSHSNTLESRSSSTEGWQAINY